MYDESNDLSTDTKNCIDRTAFLGVISTLFLCLSPLCSIPIKFSFAITGSVTALPSGVLCLKKTADGCSHLEDLMPATNTSSTTRPVSHSCFSNCFGTSDERQPLSKSSVSKTSYGGISSSINNGNLGDEEDVANNPAQQKSGCCKMF